MNKRFDLTSEGTKSAVVRSRAKEANCFCKGFNLPIIFIGNYSALVLLCFVLCLLCMKCLFRLTRAFKRLGTRLWLPQQTYGKPNLRHLITGTSVKVGIFSGRFLGIFVHGNGKIAIGETYTLMISVPLLISGFCCVKR